MATETIAPSVNRNVAMNGNDYKNATNINETAVSEVITAFLKLSWTDRAEVARGVCLVILREPSFSDPSGEPILIFDEEGNVAGILQSVEPFTQDRFSNGQNAMKSNGQVIVLKDKPKPTESRISFA